MENKELSKKDLEGILNMLKMKQSFIESCAKDYEVQIKRVENMIKSIEEPVKVVESEKN